MKNIFVLSLLLVFLFPSCKKNNPLPEPVPINLNQKAKAVVIANNQFGLELFKQISDTGFATKNIMISPLSISSALSMTYNGAKGQTKEAFDNTLHFTGLTLDEVNQSAKDLTDVLMAVDPKVTLAIANSIWYKQGFSVEDDFITRNQTYYYADVKPLDFGASQSVITINNWVDDKTNHKISKVVEMLNPDDRMLLINAIYFKGDWRNRFNAAETGSGSFHFEDGQSAFVEMMHATGDYPYFENAVLDALEMPYGQGNFSMVVLLPKEGYKVKDVLDALNAEVWSSWQEQFVLADEVPVTFPKFRFSYEKGLKDALSVLGLSEAFSNNADFTGINKDGGLKINCVKHKTYINVDEEGTEAAAVTAVTVGTTSAGPGHPFVADHPFVFIIKEKYTHAILFAGVVANPNIEE